MARDFWWPPAPPARPVRCTWWIPPPGPARARIITAATAERASTPSPATSCGGVRAPAEQAGEQRSGARIGGGHAGCAGGPRSGAGGAPRAAGPPPDRGLGRDPARGRSGELAQRRVRLARSLELPALNRG